MLKNFKLIVLASLFLVSVIEANDFASKLGTFVKPCVPFLAAAGVWGLSKYVPVRKFLDNNVSEFNTYSNEVEITAGQLVAIEGCNLLAQILASRKYNRISDALRGHRQRILGLFFLSKVCNSIWLSKVYNGIRGLGLLKSLKGLIPKWETDKGHNSYHRGFTLSSIYSYTGKLHAVYNIGDWVLAKV